MKILFYQRAFALILISLLLLSIHACDQQKEIRAKVLKHKYFENLSSASGLCMDDNKLLVVGDDVPWIFTLDTSLNLIGRQALTPVEGLENGRLPKSIKPDFEAMECFTYNESKYVLIISSGSNVGSRDTALLIHTRKEGKIVKKSLRPLFASIMLRAGISQERAINIEAVACTDKRLYLFHRGNVSGNMIISLDLDSFMDYMTHTHTETPDFSITTFELPIYNNVQSGFSGACYLASRNALLFTASLEDTRNEIDDGAILGSYIGLIPLPSIDKGLFYAGMLMDDKGIMPKKLESIALNYHIKETHIAYASCDNDDGTSDIYTIRLDF